MPAIQIKRVRKQIQSLTERYDDLPEFRRYLLDLFDQYADRTHRAGQAAEPSPLIATYNIPPPLISELVQALGPQISARPSQGTMILDSLWAEPTYETRLLATRLLRFIPLGPSGTSTQVADHARAWMRPDTDLRLVNSMMNQGLAELIRTDPQEFLSLAQFWLQSSNPFIQDLGLRALSQLISHQDVTNFPPIFKAITPLARDVTPALRPALTDLLRALAKRSPQETAFYFHDLLNARYSPQTAMLIRMCLNDLPNDLAENIRKRLRR